MKILIVGGVAAGATAAGRLRRMAKDAEIVLLEKSGHISYAACGLPYYIGGAIPALDKLLVQTPEGFREKYDIDVRVHTEVTSIDPEAHTTQVQGPDGAAYTESWDKLLLATGARPVVPPLPGVQLPGVFSLRNVEDAGAIRQYIDEHKPSTAVVVGCGFVGLEMAENLIETGLQVTAVDRLPTVLPNLDEDMATPVQKYLQEQGVALRLGASVIGFEAREGQLAVLLEGETLPCQLVILAMGVRPESTLAMQAGLTLDARGYIVVDEHLRTSHPDIYAAGDVIALKNRVTGRPDHVPLAGPANQQGRIAADNLAGHPAVYTGAQGSAIIKLFGLTVASTGLSQRAAQAQGLNYATATITAGSHAGYYPGAMPLTIKAVYQQHTGVLLGAQVAGQGGADKRADVLAAAVYARMTADDLAAMDLCYSPPYSSPKDPVNVLGNVIQGALQKSRADVPSTRALVQQVFIERKMNCAESAVMVMQEKALVKTDDFLVKSMAGFGGGMGRNYVCGAVVGAVAALGAQLGRGAAGGNREPMNTARSALLARFEARYGSLCCEELKLHDVEEAVRRQKCAEYVEAAADMAAQLIAEYNR